MSKLIDLPESLDSGSKEGLNNIAMFLKHESVNRSQSLASAISGHKVTLDESLGDNEITFVVGRGVWDALNDKAVED